jgi:phenylalanyl-tRNA synthetase beta subunit
MRPALTHGIRNALVTNNYNAPLLGKDEVRIFEMGNVFPKAGEHAAFSFGMYSADKKKAKGTEEEAKKILVDLEQVLSVQLSSGKTDVTPLGDLKYAPYVWEVNFDQLIESLPSPSIYEPLRTELSHEMYYRSLSNYPFIVRDIALFVPVTISEETPEAIIKKEAGELMVRFSQFDKFQKPGEDRISYAYRLVFQSFDRTLTDEEVNAIMEKITSRLNVNEGWEVR